MTPALVKRLRELILGKDWQGLDRFPGWTMRCGQSYGGGDHAGSGEEELQRRRWERLLGRRMRRGRPADPGVITEYLDLGSYSPEKAETVSLDKPSTLPGLATMRRW